jgi:hypothetical protein
MFAPDLSRARWRKSSRSNGAGNECVELAFVPGAIALRDSKNPTSVTLLMSPSEWDALRRATVSGRFDMD